MTKSHVWGEKETEFFFSLTPERILDAVEASGLRCTGRCFQLNSMENRVYEVELEFEGALQVGPQVAKRALALEAQSDGQLPAQIVQGNPDV